MVRTFDAQGLRAGLKRQAAFPMVVLSALFAVLAAGDASLAEPTHASRPPRTQTAQPGASLKAVAPSKPGSSVIATPAGARTPAAAPANVSAKGLVWQTDINRAMKMARDSNKMVLVDVYTDWCGWCKRLDRDTYTNAEVVKFVNAQFVPLKLDAEDGGPGQAFAEQYQISGFPCIIMLDAQGKQKGVFYGYRKAEQFNDAVRQALQEGA